MDEDIKKNLEQMVKVNIKIMKELGAASDEIQDILVKHNAFLRISDGEFCIAKKGPDGYLVEVPMY